MDKADMRTLLEMSITAQQKGAKAAELSLVRSVVAALVEQLPTTVEPTPTVNTKAVPWGVGVNTCRTCGQRKEMFQDESICKECRAASTVLTTQPSSQSDPVDTKSGPAVLHYVCVSVHQKMYRVWDSKLATVLAWEWCPVSAEPVLKSSVKTPAQGVDQPSSTSVKPDLKQSAEASYGVFAESPSNELNKARYRPMGFMH